MSIPARHALVREAYGRVAVREPAACCQSGLGCGDPTTLAALRAGETVLDLGSGPGFDCLVAAQAVGRTGRVVGIDLTEPMVALARRNALAAGVSTVAFIQGEIERLPLSGEAFDVVISNCVVNLCPDKARVFAEIHRVLKPGGRLAIADIVAVRPLPEEIADDLALYVGCVSGAAPIEPLRQALAAAGFGTAAIEIRDEAREMIAGWAPGRGLENFVAAAEITATRA